MKIAEHYKTPVRRAVLLIGDACRTSGTGHVDAQVKIKGGSLADDPRNTRGQFVLTARSDGRTRQRFVGKDLAAAIVAETALNTNDTKRIWHITEDGRKLVVTN